MTNGRRYSSVIYTLRRSQSTSVSSSLEFGLQNLFTTASMEHLNDVMNTRSAADVSQICLKPTLTRLQGSLFATKNHTEAGENHVKRTIMMVIDLKVMGILDCISAWYLNIQPTNYNIRNIWETLQRDRLKPKMQLRIRLVHPLCWLR